MIWRDMAMGKRAEAATLETDLILSKKDLPPTLVATHIVTHSSGGLKQILQPQPWNFAIRFVNPNSNFHIHLCLCLLV